MKNKNKKLMIFLYVHNYQENNINLYQNFLYKILFLNYVFYILSKLILMTKIFSNFLRFQYLVYLFFYI